MANNTIRDHLHVNTRAIEALFDPGTDLKLVLLFVLITVACIFVPVINDTIVRPVFGLAMILFIPGYALIAALFPGKSDIDGIERSVLSFGLSIAVVPLIGFALNFTSWGIRLDPMVVCLTVFTVICVYVASARRHSMANDDRFSVDFKKAYAMIKEDIFQDKTSMDRTLTAILVISILLSSATVAYMIAAPRPGEKYTEFYILGPGGKADNYSTSFYPGESKPIIVGIVNHEHRNVSYDLVVSLNDSVLINKLYSEHMAIANNQTWEKPINITPDRNGTNMELEFLLYADGNMAAPYRECHLWVNVTGNATVDKIDI